MTDIDEMNRRYQDASDRCAAAYDRARDDINFITVPGAQWDTSLRHGRKNRLQYEFPKLANHIRQVVNEMRQSRPQGKIRPVSEGDAGLAELMQGLCRNIESISNAEQAYDVAFEKAVKGGFGCWRIVTDYANQDDFDLELFIEPIRNPFSVKFDPAARRIDRRDAQFVFVEELMSKIEFQRKFPKSEMIDFKSNRDSACWTEDGLVRVAEYWWKEPTKKEIWALSNGDVVDAENLDENQLVASGITIEKRRTIDAHKVMMRLTNGQDWLTDEYEFPSRFIPIVPVWGNIEDIDGEDRWWGMVRWNKDLQRLHNVHRTAAIEAVAKAPKAPFIVKHRWIKGLERMWNSANSEDFPYLLINDDADAFPQRSQQAEVPAALLQLGQLDNEDIKASTGIYDASLGARSNETSGRGILARQQQGQTSTYNYQDNLSSAIRYTYEILIDAIPRVYDTPRVVRILGEDGGEKWKQLYHTPTDPQTGQPAVHPDGTPVVLNDISKGKYDIAITIGPSYATQRMEAVDSFTQLIGQMGGALPPQVSALMAYTALRNMDFPQMDEMVETFRKLLTDQGILQPKDGEPPPQPQQPDPLMQARVQKDQAQAEKYQAEAQAQQIENQLQTQQFGIAPPNNVMQTTDMQQENPQQPQMPPQLQMPQPPEQPPQPPVPDMGQLPEQPQ